MLGYPWGAHAPVIEWRACRFVDGDYDPRMVMLQSSLKAQVAQLGQALAAPCCVRHAAPYIVLGMLCAGGDLSLVCCALQEAGRSV